MNKLFLLIFILFPLSLYSQWEEIESPMGTEVNSIQNLNGIKYAATKHGLYIYVEVDNSWNLLYDFDKLEVLSIFENNGVLFAGTKGGTYRSLNNGQNWETTSVYMSNTLDWEAYGNYILAAYWDGIYRSNDNGETWEQTSNSDNGRFLQLITYNDSLLAGTELGIYMSADSGKTWNPKVNGLVQYRDVNSLIQVGTTLVAGLIDEGVFISDDGAETWTSANTGLNNKDIYSLYNLNDTLWAGTSDSVFYCTNLSSPIWKSLKVNSPPSPIKTLNSVQENVILGNSSGVSIIEGNEFELFNNGFPNRYISNTFGIFDEYYAKSDRFYRYNKPKNTWEYYSNIPAGSKSLLTMNDTVIVAYIDSDDDVIVSFDSTKTWQTITEGILSIKAITVHNNIIYFAKDNGDVLYTSDYGANWQTINGNLTGIEQIAATDNYVYAVSDQLYRSQNYNQWEPLGFQFTQKTFIHTFNDSLYVSCSNIDTYYFSLYKSTDNGNNFEYLIGINAPYDGINYIVWDTRFFCILPSAMICPEGKNFNMAFNDKTWLRLSRGIEFQSENASMLYASEAKDGIFLTNTDFDMWYRKLTDLNVPSAPSNVKYSIGSGNNISVRWDDNSDNETAFRLRRFKEENDIIFHADITQISFDIDTLSSTPSDFEFPFFMVADNNGDWSLFSDECTVDDSNNIDLTKKNEQGVFIYPNPTKKYVWVETKNINNHPEKITLVNINGIELLQIVNPKSNKFKIDIETLPVGVYFLKIEYLNDIRDVIKILKI